MFTQIANYYFDNYFDTGLQMLEQYTHELNGIPFYLFIFAFYGKRISMTFHNGVDIEYKFKQELEKNGIEI